MHSSCFPHTVSAGQKAESFSSDILISTMKKSDDQRDGEPAKYRDLELGKKCSEN